MMKLVNITILNQVGKEYWISNNTRRNKKMVKIN